MKLSRRSRSAFTLIELLVVIAIIAILVSLLSAAVMRTLFKGPEVQCRADISAMSSAVENYKQSFDNVNYVPSMLVLYSDLSKYGTGTVSKANNLPLQVEIDSINYLRQVFGRRLGVNVNGAAVKINWTGASPAVLNTATLLTGDQCLVFFLGGIPSSGTPGCLGFSTDPTDPSQASAAGVARRGPFFDFKANRLNRLGNGFFNYYDSFNKNQPYAYFSAYKGANGYSPYATKANPASDCFTLGVSPYYQTTTAPAGTVVPAPGSSFQTVYYQPTSFQIVSAGADGKFGAGGQWVASSGQPGLDDWSNFSRLFLGAAQAQ
jgi:prepilin-type N-terminal cleavage/methylation domain-containing protein